MKRFLLFVYMDYYPGGGIDDLKGSFDTLAEAIEHTEPKMDAHPYWRGQENIYAWDQVAGVKHVRGADGVWRVADA